MDDLARWLGEQFDEDERIARAADAELSSVFTRIECFDPDMAADERHIMAHRPARVLREIDVKRRLLFQFKHRGDSVRATVQPSTGGVWDDLLRMLVLPYADRPGYRKEWAP